MHTLELLVNGTRYAGFVGGTIQRSLDTPASSFDLEYSATFEQDGARIPIREGDRCVVLMDDETIITGFVDRSTIRVSPDRIEYRVSGRSLVADLVDSQAEARTFVDTSLSTIANTLCDGFAALPFVLGDTRAPVGQFVRARAAQPATASRKATEARAAFTRFKAEAGEPVIDVLRRAASLRGMRLFDSPDGNLVISVVGDSSAEMTLSVTDGRVLTGEREGDWSQRFSTYVYHSQTHARGQLKGRAGHRIRGEALDPALSDRDRYRPQIFTRRGAGGERDLAKVASLERNRAAGRSETVRYTITGWHDGNGAAWAPGSLVEVDDGTLRVRGTMVVASVSYKLGAEEPYQTDLVLRWPEAYDEIDFPTRGGGDVWG